MGTSSKRSNLAQIVLAAFIAFAVGALVVWVILSTHRQNPQNLATPSSAVAPSPPDTAGLAPGQAALAMANWFFDNHTWPKAIDEYEKAISLGLDNADLRTDLGSAYRFSGQNAKAIEQYEIAQRENPQHENSLFNLARHSISRRRMSPPRRPSFWRTSVSDSPRAAPCRACRSCWTRRRQKCLTRR